MQTYKAINGGSYTRKMQGSNREKLLRHSQSYSTLFGVRDWVPMLCTSPYQSIGEWNQDSTAGSASGVVSVYFMNLFPNE